MVRLHNYNTHLKHEKYSPSQLCPYRQEVASSHHNHSSENWLEPGHDNN